MPTLYTILLHESCCLRSVSRLFSGSGLPRSTSVCDDVSTSRVSDDDEREEYIDMSKHKVMKYAAYEVRGTASEITETFAVSSDIDTTLGVCIL